LITVKHYVVFAVENFALYLLHDRHMTLLDLEEEGSSSLKPAPNAQPNATAAWRSQSAKQVQ
jgi:hypothetical protein